MRGEKGGALVPDAVHRLRSGLSSGSTRSPGSKGARREVEGYTALQHRRALVNILCDTVKHACTSCMVQTAYKNDARGLMNWDVAITAV